MLLDEFGGDELNKALVAVNERDVDNTKADRQLLEQQARAATRKPRQPVQLPRRDLEDLYVPKVDLGSYDPPDNIDSDAEKETF